MAAGSLTILIVHVGQQIGLLLEGAFGILPDPGVPGGAVVLVETSGDRAVVGHLWNPFGHSSTLVEDCFDTFGQVKSKPNQYETSLHPFCTVPLRTVPLPVYGSCPDTEHPGSSWGAWAEGFCQ